MASWHCMYAALFLRDAYGMLCVCAHAILKLYTANSIASFSTWIVPMARCSPLNMQAQNIIMGYAVLA